jgi:hypothetical protein
MMEKLAQAGEGEGCTPTIHYIYHHVKVAVYTLQLGGQIHPAYFISIPIYSVVQIKHM